MSSPGYLSVRFTTLTAAAAILVFTAGNSAGADCGCEIPCDACSAELEGCDGGCCDSHREGCLSHRLEKVKNRMHQLFSKKWSNWSLCGRKDSGCDDACDAASMEELMWPADGSMHEHVLPHGDAGLPEPQSIHPMPMSGSESGVMKQPVNRVEPKSDAKLFESLQDPFSDDQEPSEVPRSVRRSSHEGVVLQPAPKQTPSRNYETSSRRVKSVR